MSFRGPSTRQAPLQWGLLLLCGALLLLGLVSASVTTITVTSSPTPTLTSVTSQSTPAATSRVQSHRSSESGSRSAHADHQLVVSSNGTNSNSNSTRHRWCPSACTCAPEPSTIVPNGAQKRLTEASAASLWTVIAAKSNEKSTPEMPGAGSSSDQAKQQMAPGELNRLSPSLFRIDCSGIGLTSVVALSGDEEVETTKPPENSEKEEQEQLERPLVSTL